MADTAFFRYRQQDFSGIDSGNMRGKTPDMSESQFGEFVQAEMIRRGFNQHSLATRAGLKPDVVRDLIRGRASYPRLDTALALARGLGISIQELAEMHVINSTTQSTNEQKLPPHAVREDIEYNGRAYASLPLFEVMASAGPGSFNADNPEPEDWTLLSIDQLRMVTRARLDQLAMIRVSGDSMTPTLMHNDQILVDRSVARIGRDGMYVIATGDEVQVKRITRDWASKSLTVASDNGVYPPSTGVQEEDLIVLGRVVWISRSVGG